MALSFDPIDEARRNWDQQGWGAVDSMTAATSITRAHQILLGRVDAVLSPLGLNFSRAGELPLGKMGERLQVHPASVTNTIDRLERDGLVQRVAHPTDGRATLARITGTGRRLVDQAQQALADIDFGLDGMTPDQLTRITHDITNLRHEAGDWGA